MLIMRKIINLNYLIDNYLILFNNFFSPSSHKNPGDVKLNSAIVFSNDYSITQIILRCHMYYFIILYSLNYDTTEINTKLYNDNTEI